MGAVGAWSRGRLLTRDLILDHPAGGFPWGNTHGGPDAPEAFMSDFGGLLPVVL